MITADVIDALVASGATVEMLAAAVKASLPKRSSGAERQARYMAKLKASKASESVSTDVTDASLTASHALTCSNTLEVKKDNIPPQKTASSSTPRGQTIQKSGAATRIPTDWLPSDQDREFARSEGFDEVGVDREAQRFRDYFRAASGATSRKCDWTATWRNWIRRASENKNIARNGVRSEPKSMTTFSLELMRDLRGQRDNQAGSDYTNSDFGSARPQAEHTQQSVPTFARSY